MKEKAKLNKEKKKWIEDNPNYIFKIPDFYKDQLKIDDLEGIQIAGQKLGCLKKEMIAQLYEFAHIDSISTFESSADKSFDLLCQD